MTLTKHDIDVIKSMPRKELNAECLHLMREQTELFQELHYLRKRTKALERVAEAASWFISYRGNKQEDERLQTLTEAVHAWEAMDK